MNFLNLEHNNARCLTVVAAKEQLSSELDGEAVILNLKTGTYHGLDAVGARIWSLLQESRTVNEILNTLLAEYEVDAERCERELLSLLQQLGDQELIEVKSETAA